VFIGLRPGAAASVLETFGDLREAGIDPADLETCADDPRTRDLAELFGLYDAALAERAGDGWTDDAGFARAALPHTAQFGESVRAVFVHGAYELLGVYRNLLRELDRSSEVTVLAPVAAGTRATEYGERFVRSFFTDGALETPDEPGDRERAARLAALYDEESAPPAADPGRFRFRHAQGPAAEVTFAVRQALCAVREGCPPAEIAITARSLEPYAAALEEALDDAGLPWTSSLASHLRRQPIVREFLLLLRVLSDGFPRESTVELLQSRLVDWKSIGCERPAADRADRWSRDADIIDGLDEWTGRLESWAGQPRLRADPTDEDRARAEEYARQRAEDARKIGDTLQRLDAEVPRSDATWSAHSAALSSILDRIFASADEPAADQLRDILDAMNDLECLAGDRRQVEFREALDWLERAVSSTSLSLRRGDDGGIRVLDAMQLRGLTFRHVHLVGMTSGLFPRTPRQDPVLTDEMRRALRERTGRPIGIKAEGTEEEHQLLAMLLGSARERIDVSWQRADESGRAKIASLALREIARLANGRPDIEGLREQALHLPSHPTQWLEALVEHTGLLARREERLLAALHSRAVDAAEMLGKRFPDLVPGLAMLRATQSFTPVGHEYDGRIGPFERDKPLSVSEIGGLGSCPLSFFFGSILRVKKLEDSANELELAPNKLGNRIHEMLEAVYGVLETEGLFARGDGESLTRRGLELLDARRGQIFGDVGTRLASRVPRLWEHETRKWFEAVRRFVEDDLRRIGDAGLEPISLEELVSESLDFGEGCVEVVRGKFDRLLEGDNLRVVGDYKTSPNLPWRVQPASMLKAISLQIPLYRMLAGGDAAVDLLGVHPDLDPDDDGQRYRFAGFQNDILSRSFLHTMRVLLGLRRQGIYPFQEGRQCNWCDYTRACRRNHPPSRDRELQLPDAAAYRAVLRKSTRNPNGC
jgi:ATP-dependent helicase/nuclease subunit B